jgi:hypothetical protein
VFFIKKQIGNIKVPIHTGGVDAMWLSKLAIPCESCDQSQPSEPKADAKHQGLAMALDDLQSKKTLKKKHLEITGRSLQKRMAMSKEENTVRELIKKSMKIPGEF